MPDVHVAAICGSLREESKTRVAIRHALDASERVGASTELIDLREYDLPLYDADEDPAGDAPKLTRKLRDADSILLGTPMYHGSYSSPLKTALDYSGFDEFENKTVGLLAVAGGSFPTSSLDHLRLVCRALNAWVLPHQVAVPRARMAIEERVVPEEQRDGDGEAVEMRFVEQSLEERVAVLGRRLVQYANIEPDPASFESEENVGA
jgi:NAD(P)H-dependent FMN reductase